MLTGHLYLSSDLSGGVFDEASRSLEREEKKRITGPCELLSMVCAWKYNKVLSRVKPNQPDASICIARDAPSSTRRVLPSYTLTIIIPFNTLLDMDSDEDMQPIDSDLPSINKGKGKAVLHDETEDTTTGRDDTLPWYIRSSCDEYLDQQRVHTG
jgi:hypothetical protein